MGFFDQLWKNQAKKAETQGDSDRFKSYLVLPYPETFDSRIDEPYYKDPEMKQFIDYMNSDNVQGAENSFNTLISKHPDFSMLYYWLAITYRSTNKYDQGIAILNEGLKKCSMRHNLYTLLGEIEFSRKNIDIAIKWWAQSIVAQAQIQKFRDFVPFLYFGYVAMDIPDTNLSYNFFNRGDEIRYGQIRFNPPVVNEIHSLMKKYMQTISLDEKKQLTQVLKELSQMR